jgi:hypothetical protein
VVVVVQAMDLVALAVVVPAADQSEPQLPVT